MGVKFSWYLEGKKDACKTSNSFFVPHENHAKLNFHRHPFFLWNIVIYLKHILATSKLCKLMSFWMKCMNHMYNNIGFGPMQVCCYLYPWCSKNHRHVPHDVLNRTHSQWPTEKYPLLLLEESNRRVIDTWNLWVSLWIGPIFNQYHNIKVSNQLIKLVHICYKL